MKRKTPHRATSNQEFGLEVKSFPKNKQWAIDQDYTDKLTEAEKAWLGQFNQEYYRGRVDAKDPNSLHNTSELRKDCYNRNNASNRDLYAIKNVGNMVIGSSTVHDSEGNEADLLDMVPSYDTEILAFEEEYDKQLLKKKRK